MSDRQRDVTKVRPNHIHVRSAVATCRSWRPSTMRLSPNLEIWRSANRKPFSAYSDESSGISCSAARGRLGI